jgi:cytochrome c
MENSGVEVEHRLRRPNHFGSLSRMQYGRTVMKFFGRRPLLAAFLVMVGLTAASIAGAQTPDAPVLDGETLFNQRTCFTCHGKDGKTPILPFYPIIAGQNAEYALQQMKDIKSGARANGNTASMRGVMHLVNEEEMKVLAEYISTLER